jgi:hypothetical protein
LDNKNIQADESLLRICGGKKKNVSIIEANRHPESSESDILGTVSIHDYSSFLQA